eukprot:955791-Pleurochrysis_carterae.AAC.1
MHAQTPLRMCVRVCECASVSVCLCVSARGSWSRRRCVLCLKSCCRTAFRWLDVVRPAGRAGEA